MKRSRIQGHGEEGWGSRGSRFDRGRAIAPDGTQVGRCNVLIAKAIQDAGAELCLPTSRRVDIKKDPQAPKGK